MAAKALANRPTDGAVASNCVAVVDRYISVFNLAPLSPPALSRPAGREREPTALFGRVIKQRKYPCPGTLFVIARSAATRQSTATALACQHGLLRCACNDEASGFRFPVFFVPVPPAVMRKAGSARFYGSLMSTCISSEYFLALNTWPNVAVGSSFPPAGARPGLP